MEEVTYGKKLKVDRCLACQGIWFDTGEVEALSGKWMSESVDTGDPKVGSWLNQRHQINCPRCQQLMSVQVQTGKTDIWYEVCEQHGMYFDAGEFSAAQYDTLMAKFKSFSG
jgi:Zn-finger nucleic acid-binding protein